MPACGIKRKQPRGQANAGKLRPQIIERMLRLTGNVRIGTVARLAKPIQSVAVLMQKVIRPTHLEHDGVVFRIRFMSNLQIAKRVLQITGAVTAFIHHPRVGIGSGHHSRC